MAPDACTYALIWRRCDYSKAVMGGGAGRRTLMLARVSTYYHATCRYCDVVAWSLWEGYEWSLCYDRWRLASPGYLSVNNWDDAGAG